MPKGKATASSVIRNETVIYQPQFAFRGTCAYVDSEKDCWVSSEGYVENRWIKYEFEEPK